MRKFGLLSLISATTAAALLAAPAFADAPIHGSIKLPTKLANAEAPANGHTATAKALRHFAKLSDKRAIAVAEHHIKGKVDKLLLEDEDGYLVYSVFLGGHEVLVDAGNGKVLGDERESATEND